MYYRHSGCFSVGGLILALATGAAAAVVFAYAYGNGLSHIPEVHLAALATFVFGALVGGTTGYALVWGHVRNQRLTFAVTTLTSIVALYLSWAVWIAEIFKRSQGKSISWIGLAQHPAAIWALMKWINHYGTWALDSGAPTAGWSLWLVWTLEAVLILVGAVAVAVVMLRERAYCETCGRWCRRAVRVLLTPLPDALQLRLQLENEDLSPLESLGLGNKAADHLQLSLESCVHCNQFHTLTLTQVSIARRRFGHPSVSSKAIVRQLMVSAGAAERIHGLSDKLAHAPKISSERARGTAAGRS